MSTTDVAQPSSVQDVFSMFDEVTKKYLCQLTEHLFADVMCNAKQEGLSPNSPSVSFQKAVHKLVLSRIHYEHDIFLRFGDMGKLYKELMHALTSSVITYYYEQEQGAQLDTLGYEGLRGLEEGKVLSATDLKMYCAGHLTFRVCKQEGNTLLQLDLDSLENVKQVHRIKVDTLYATIQVLCAKLLLQIATGMPIGSFMSREVVASFGPVDLNFIVCREDLKHLQGVAKRDLLLKMIAVFRPDWVRAEVS